MAKKSRKAEKAKYNVTRARSVLVISQPFYGCLALHLKLICADDLPYNISTMAVDGKNLYYNSNFTNGLSDEECVGVVAHEVTHCAYRHMTRIAGRNPFIWNLANDFIINKDILEAGFTLPGEPATWDEIKSGKTNEKCYLLDPQFDGMSSEEVYEIIRQEINENKKLAQASKDSGSGEGDSIPDPGGCGGVMQSRPDHDVKGLKEIDDYWSTVAIQAANIAKTQNAGNLPSNIKRLIGDLEAPKVSWEEQLRRFNDETLKKDFTWMKANRRFIHGGLYLPSLKAEGIRQIVLAVDTSGSIDQELLTKFASEIRAILDEGLADKVTVIYADTNVHHVDEFEAGDVLEINAVGGGGTDFEDTYRWISENAPDASVVIYFTDLHVFNHGEDPGIPVLWATYGRSGEFEQVKDDVPFGEVIHISH